MKVIILFISIFIFYHFLSKYNIPKKIFKDVLGIKDPTYIFLIYIVAYVFTSHLIHNFTNPLLYLQQFNINLLRVTTDGFYILTLYFTMVE